MVAAGDSLISPSMTRRLIEEFATNAKPSRPAKELDVLTNREREVLALVAGGLTNDEIGQRLYLSPATALTRRRWAAAGGDPELIYEVAMWSVPAGIIGGRIYFDITTPMDVPHVWYRVFAVWSGGLGIWGAIPVAVLVGAWRVRKAGGSVPLIMDAVAPALLVAQGIGRIGNYFNKELFGGPTSLPWGLEIPVAYRPTGYTAFAYFQPTFLYELIWDVALAAFLVWLGHHRRIFAPGLFALYVAGYSAFRIFEESLRVDSSKYFLGLRLNMYVACTLTVAGLAWFAVVQRRGRRKAAAGLPAPELAAGGAGPERAITETPAARHDRVLRRGSDQVPGDSPVE